MEGLFPILVLGAIVAIIVGAIYSRKHAEERRVALASLAAELGWSFNPAKIDSLSTDYPQFEVFQRGHSRNGYNTMTGTLAMGAHNVPVVAGDYTYAVTRSTGKSRTTTTYHFSYLIARLPFANLPSLAIRPEGFFDRIGAALGFDDIDFESTEFSRQFHVKSSDKKFAYALCDPRMMEFLLQAKLPNINLSGGCGFFSDEVTSWEPAAFRQVVAATREFLNHWPQHLVKELAER